MLFKFFNITGLPASILSIAIMLFAGFLMTRLTKPLRLPNVTGYILAGILIGPSVLGIVPEEIVSGMEFLTDVALAFIAFGVGRYFKLAKLRENGVQVLVITLFESLLAGAAITLLMLYVFRMNFGVSLLMGAIASATAPASTIMTIRQYKAKSPFVDLLLAIIAMDNAIALIAFSVCAAIVTSTSAEGKFSFAMLAAPVLINLGSVVVGILFGFFLRLFIRSRTRSADNRLILAIALLMTLSGLCAYFDISPLLACMAMGATYRNICKDREIFDQVSDFMPPILSLFFVLSGMRLNISSVVGVGWAGISYFILRIGAKYLGAYLGAAISRAPADARKYLGLGLAPQAGVAIGLAILGQRILPPAEGTLLSTIVLATSVLYETIGPASAKLSLHLSKSIPVSAVPDMSASADGQFLLPPEPGNGNGNGNGDTPEYQTTLCEDEKEYDYTMLKDSQGGGGR